MTIDEAIKHCEEVADSHDSIKQIRAVTLEECRCAEEHRQLAEWLKELKELRVHCSQLRRDCNEAIDVIGKLRDELKAYKEKETCETCGHHKAYQHGADITTMDDECGGCCSWNSKWIPNTCGDAISRQAVLNAITMAEVRWQAVDNVNKLPFVSPQPKVGRWIPTGYDGYADGNPVYDWWECSKCGWEHTGDEESLTAFCPNCGAKMEDVKENG